MQILVIDDDPHLLEDVKTILELNGYDVLLANNGLEGLRLIHDHHPMLIICDINMPEVSGYEVLEELQANSTTASIPIIFLTAQSNAEDFRRGMQAGADDYLTKPFREEDLLTAVWTRIEKRHRWELQQRVTFSHHLVQAQEHELHQIAHELDQSLRQKLLNMKFFLETQGPLGQNSVVLEPVQRILNELLTEVTNISYSLYPIMLAHLGLIPTLQWYLNACEQRLNVKVTLDVYNLSGRLIDSVELALYRITQRVMESVATTANDIKLVFWCDENSVRFSISHLPLLERTQEWQLLQLLESYGHTINASVVMQSESESSTVYVTIPDAVYQQSDSGVPSVPPSSTVGYKTVLVVSSDDAFLSRAIKMLEPVVQVVPFQTSDPDQVPNLLKIHPPHILVLDLAVRASVLSSLLLETAVILLTTHQNETFARQTLRQGVMGLIPRGKANTELLSAVQTVLQHERYVSASLVLGGEETAKTKPLNLDVLLTRREREIMELILQDKTHTDIALELVISPRTVEKHRANMMQKLALNTHTELIMFAMRHGLMSSD